MRTLVSILAILIALGSAFVSAGQAPDLVERARPLYPPLRGAGEPTLTRLPAVDSTALGCELLRGLPLPDRLDVYRLEFPLDSGAFAVHVSADGSLAQACDERWPNLGGGTQLVARADADSDGDGHPDEADACPYIAGSPASRGCPLLSPPDRDGDGVPDSADACADQAGAPAAAGCALLADGDGDGVPDHVDICDADFGPWRPELARGCPADGSGSSTRRRGAADICHVRAVEAPLRASGDESSAVIGRITDVESRAIIGRSADGLWLQLAAGWLSGDDAELAGACYNNPLVNAEAGGATGCFLRPLGEYVNVRGGPAGAVVTRLEEPTPQAVLGRNSAGDWLMYREGWVSRAVAELSGSCENLPVLDPALAGSGVIHFCPPNFRGFLPPRVDVGGAARVVSESLANRLRARPSIDARQIGEIAPRRTIDAVLDGPACNGPWVWWQVAIDGLVGWTVESDVNYNYYYLEPLHGAAPADDSRRALGGATFDSAGGRIHSGNIDSLNTVGILPAGQPRRLAWSPQQTWLAALGANGAIRLYRADGLSDHEDILDTTPASAMAFSPDERWLALGDVNGGIRLHDNQGASPASQARFMRQLDGPIRALNWSRAGDKLAAISGAEELTLARRAGTLKVWTIDASAPENSRLALHERFPYPLTALAFSADDRWLAVTGESSSAGRAALWVYAADSSELRWAKPLIPLGGYSSVAPSPTSGLGDFIYSSGDSLYGLDAATGVGQRFYHLAGALVKQFAFRPQSMAGAEALLALAVASPRGADQLRLANALSPYGNATTLDISADAVAFSPDGRYLALADAAGGRILVLAAER